MNFIGEGRDNRRDGLEVRPEAPFIYINVLLGVGVARTRVMGLTYDCRTRYVVKVDGGNNIGVHGRI